jgi:hypothetical protein
MSGRSLIRAGALTACFTLLGFSGCEPKNNAPPPSGEAVTTEALDIELPAQEEPAAAAGSEAAATPATDKPAEVAVP